MSSCLGLFIQDNLIKYAKVCKIKKIYDEIYELTEILKTEVDSLEKDEVDEYRSLIDDLQNSGESYVEDLGEEDIEEDISYLSDDINLIIYSNFIDESYDKTVNAHSGKEEQSLKAIANLIEQLNKCDYQDLRQKGYELKRTALDNYHVLYTESNLGFVFSRTNDNTALRFPLTEKRHGARDM